MVGKTIYIIHYQYNDYKSGDCGEEVYAYASWEGEKKKFEELYDEKVSSQFTEPEQEDFEHYYRSEREWQLRDKHGYSNSCYIFDKELQP